MAEIAPSVLGADFARLGEEIASAGEAGVNMLHLDIMDGHFVPNISFGPAVVARIDQLTDAYLDVHLMLSEPEKYFDDFVKAGADAITFHLQVHPDPVPYARQIRDMGVHAGISINPDIPVDNVLPYLEHFDLFLAMSVFPGFGGQKFIPEVLDKVRTARKHIDSNGLATKIMIDGGVDLTNAAEVVAAGADILVMGTAFFSAHD
ncbi:MAG: ribulose-phosphate 3-epimerase [candidate division Zixibacteria bacterium]|nr:ribulose-phosphate 3-epimerase [candidate division Zixibacteria bacterium]